MNYTQGKWEYYEGIAAPAVIVKGKPNRPNKLICHARLFNGSEDLAEAQANAHLIASAPTMYEALKALIEHMTLPKNELGRPYLADVRRMAEKALAKAESKE